MDSIFKPLWIYCDNLALVFLPKNNNSESQSKHIDIKYLALKEHVKANEELLEHITVELITSDPLPKGMPPKLLKDCVVQMGITLLSAIWFDVIWNSKRSICLLVWFRTHIYLRTTNIFWGFRISISDSIEYHIIGFMQKRRWLRNTWKVILISMGAYRHDSCDLFFKHKVFKYILWVLGENARRSIKQSLFAASTMELELFLLLRRHHKVFGLRVSSPCVELWILSLRHWELLVTI